MGDAADSEAVSASPSPSLSLPSTPGAETDFVTPAVAEYESPAATGVALRIVIVTVVEAHWKSRQPVGW